MCSIAVPGPLPQPVIDHSGRNPDQPTVQRVQMAADLRQLRLDLRQPVDISAARAPTGTSTSCHINTAREHPLIMNEGCDSHE
jgi:hypothetical protein